MQSQLRCRYLPVGVVEGHRVDDVRVLVEGKQFLARVRVPDLARAVVAARDELAAALVEGAVRERQKVRSKDLEKSELLHLVFLLFLDELFDEFFELGLAGFRDEWLFEQNLVNKAVDVRSVGEKGSTRRGQTSQTTKAATGEQKIWKLKCILRQY